MRKSGAPRFLAGAGRLVVCVRGACGYPLFPCGRMAVRKAQLCRAEGRKGPRRRLRIFCLAMDCTLLRYEHLRRY